MTRSPKMLTSEEAMRRALVWNFVAAGAVAVGGAAVGGLLVGGIGVVSGLIGGAIAALLAGLTGLSILISGRYAGTPGYVLTFAALIMGGWFVKIVVFLAIALALRGQPWVQPTVLFLTVIVAVLVSLAVDAVVIMKSRVLYVSDVG